MTISADGYKELEQEHHSSKSELSDLLSCDSALLAVIEYWDTFSANCPWRSETYTHAHSNDLPGRCTAVRQSAWLEKCTVEKCAPFHFMKLLVPDALRYNWLRERDLEAIGNGGVFVGKTPDNVVLNGTDLDNAIDAEAAR